ncbi:hypothetical protein [Paraburkholderia agricolaris]|uniref:hypothetical protein n=1 Tax=Paraburkholderia agricolaris TaxID=2152888 RepID=UPI0012927113|nr:hypothetical protein [Paraburkholderia agricolaris]
MKTQSSSVPFVKTPISIKAALVSFSLAFLCETYVEWLKLLDPKTTIIGYTAICVSVIANLLAVYFCHSGRRWARDLLILIAATTLVWTKVNLEWLKAAGPLPAALITLTAFLRFGAVIALRRPASNQWFDANGSGSRLWGFRPVDKPIDTRRVMALKAGGGITLAIALLSFVPGTPLSGMYWLGSFALVACIAFNVLAFRPTRKNS